MRIPFRSIRFKDGSDVWGVNFRRMVRWKNEISYLNGVPRSWGRRGLNKLSSAATVVGLETPAKSLNIDVKPYALGSVLTNTLATPAVRNRADATFGGDAKWGITQQLVADFTYNTDFAQVEDDEAQVNLTRFSLFFPEKRDFFLEGQDVVRLRRAWAAAAGGGGGGGGAGGGGGGGNNGGGSQPENLTPILFYSRRIGLTGVGAVPIIGGARVLGRTGAWQVGALSMQTEDAPLDAGALDQLLGAAREPRRPQPQPASASSPPAARPTATPRPTTSPAAPTRRSTSASDLQINSLLGPHPEPTTPRATSRAIAGRVDWNADRYAVNLEHLYVGEGFKPEVGFMRRSDFRRSYGLARFSPRPTDFLNVRKFYFQASADYITGASRRASRREEYQGQFNTEFNNGDLFELRGDPRRSRRSSRRSTSPAACRCRPASTGSRRARRRTRWACSAGSAARITAGYGGFYDGTLTELTWRGRVEFTPQLYAEPTLSWNRIEAPYGNGNANLAATRLTYHRDAADVRGRAGAVPVAHRVDVDQPALPLGVPAGQRAVRRLQRRPDHRWPARYPELQSRSVVVKVTKLFRW